MPEKTEVIYCPLCNAQGNKQPVLVAMNIQSDIGDDKKPRTRYTCSRCGWQELHET